MAKSSNGLLMNLCAGEPAGPGRTTVSVECLNEMLEGVEIAKRQASTYKQMTNPKAGRESRIPTFSSALPGGDTAGAGKDDYDTKIWEVPLHRLVGDEMTLAFVPCSIVDLGIFSNEFVYEFTVKGATGQEATSAQAGGIGKQE